ncbi:hypothetical protein [Marinobacter sp.]|uniref:hypothetical protein n=1 Tax=Marinobacter sp. TaxID=50741 RepID=UPI003A91574D
MDELASSLSHGLKLLALLAGTLFLIINALKAGASGFFVGSVIFAATAILLYFFPTVYHPLTPGKAKKLFFGLSTGPQYSCASLAPTRPLP